MENEQNTNPFQFVNENNVIAEPETKNTQETIVTNSSFKPEEDFITGLPDWDLAPPYEVVRRVIR